MHRFPTSLRLTQEDAIMLAAMVAGDRTYLSHSIRVGFERTGSFHMLVVSGFHLAIVAAFIFWITRRLRIPRVPATILTILVSFAYALFSGFATPVQRSLWMVTLYLLGRLVYRERNPLNTIGFASLCLLVASPRSLFDSSLQMTLLAVVAIAGVAAPLLQGTIHPYLNATRDLRLIALDAKLEPHLAQFRDMLRMVAAHLQRVGHGRAGAFVAWRLFPWNVRFMLRIVELMVVSSVVELVMVWPMAVYFHRITFFALPVNMFIFPLLAILMPAALITLMLLAVWPTAAVAPAMIVAVVLHAGVWLVHLFGSIAFGDFRIAGPLLWQSAVFFGLVAAAIALAQLSTGSHKRWQRRLACAALLLGAVAAVAPRPVEHPHDALLIEAIDVGQGDSLLLITPDGKTLLVDGGGFGGGPQQAAQDYDIGEEVVSPALWARGIHHLDAVALSHAHSDHMGGVPSVLRNFNPDELWVGNNPPGEAYDALLEEAASLHVRVRSLRAGDGFSFGNSQIGVLAPLPGYVPKAEPGNNDSLVLHVGYGSTSVLLEGDAEAAVEDAMLGENGLESTLLKVGHHGSLTSTRPEFLARVTPQFALISCGLRNRYGHPREEVLEELQKAHVRTFRTDTGGASCFVLDGKTATTELGCMERGMR
jgi:competence protein ComEC